MNSAVLQSVLIAQVVASGMMAGLIWFVQVVHYPLFDGVDTRAFQRYAVRHRGRTTYIVAPLMFAELGCAIALLPLFGAPTPAVLAYCGLGLVSAAWGITFFVSVPLHMRLDRGFDARAHRMLVRTNWARTAVWSARLGVSIAMLVSAGNSLYS